MQTTNSKSDRDRVRQRATAKKEIGGMNIHDKARKDALARSLSLAKERAETHRLYLTALDRDPEDVATANVVLEHINIALVHLGALVPADT